jgi:hypothetical protein
MHKAYIDLLLFNLKAGRRVDMTGNIETEITSPR